MPCEALAKQGLIEDLSVTRFLWPDVVKLTDLRMYVNVCILLCMVHLDVPAHGRGIEKDEDAEGFYRRMMLKLKDCGVQLSPKARFLEVGSGSGAVLNRLREKGFDIEGVDNSPRGLGVKKADAATLLYENESFDCVISKQVLDGWVYEQFPENQQAMLREIVRVLKKGGVYYAEELLFESIDGLERVSDPTGNQNSWVYKKV